MPGIDEYRVPRDNFEFKENPFGFDFPCCCCIQNEKGPKDDPCRTCDHNGNADGDEPVEFDENQIWF